MLFTLTPMAPIASACLAKSTRAAVLLPRQVSSELLKDGTPFARCSRSMTRNPALSQTTTIILWPVITEE